MQDRHATRVKNPGGCIVLGGDNVPSLVEIGLTDLPKSGGARAPPLATGLRNINIFPDMHQLFSQLIAYM